MKRSIIRFFIRQKVRAYLKKHKPLLVFVTGSVGKTVTKQAIATVLSEKHRVRAHDNTHDDRELGLACALVGIEYPEDPGSIGQWRAVLAAMDVRIAESKDVDVIVQEIRTTKPGDIVALTKDYAPDIAVVTSVSEENMQIFGSLDAVATEELSIANIAKLTVIGRDDVDARFAPLAETQNIDTYGIGEQAEYRLVLEPADPLDGRIGKMLTPEWGELSVTVQLVGDHNLKSAAAAACVGAKLGLTSRELAVGVSKIKPVAGRMNLLRGLERSTIIDDSYQANPSTVAAAMNTLLGTDTPQRIAVLGSMSDLAGSSGQAHEIIGLMCKPDQLDWVITIGDDAEKYLAPAAQKSGCQVKSFKTPYQAGGFAHSVLKPGATVLVTGSCDGIFAEEAVKVLLHDTEDEEKLVRQTPYWLAKKDALFDHEVAED